MTRVAKFWMLIIGFFLVMLIDEILAIFFLDSVFDISIEMILLGLSLSVLFTAYQIKGGEG